MRESRACLKEEKTVDQTPTVAATTLAAGQADRQASSCTANSVAMSEISGVAIAARRFGVIKCESRINMAKANS